jgi:two-component system sensor histidine kinase/response regulator
MNTPTADGARILLAEDNPVNQKIARKILERMGCEVVSALDGAEALELWSSQKFDLILMDVQMPVLDGLSATRRLREMEATRGTRTPILALTANVLTEDIARCREAGMDGHLPKPFLIEDVQATVADWVSRRAA